MRISDSFTDYCLLDATENNRLERWGEVTLIRPDPQVLWSGGDKKGWDKADAIYHRSNEGGGRWELINKIPQKWSIKYKTLTFIVSPTGFKHTGLFPEQAVNWELYTDIIKKSRKKIKVLNLFGYTGGATLAAAAAGAEVVHVDASKAIVAWARENCSASGLEGKPIRWLVEDCLKFVAREIRRCSSYDAIIMDPPSYGRGPNGEIWKLEENIEQLIKDTAKLLSKDALFLAVNSYTAAISPSVIKVMLQREITDNRGGSCSCSEIGLRAKNTAIELPCGSTAIWTKDKS